MLGAKTIARAKINLYLGVGGVREDGYHEVWTVMQALDLCDELYFRRTDDINGKVRIRSNEPRVPTDDTNLVCRAVDIFREVTGTGSNCGLEVLINKKIPVAAGLAGGSADCAAALLALDYIFETELAPDSLVEMAEKLGSDVPFCLEGGTAVASGRGERVEKIADLPQMQVVVVSPGFEVSTAEAYALYDESLKDGAPDGAALEKSMNEMVKCLVRHDFEYVFTNLYNSLELTAPARDRVEELKEIAMKSGASATLMSGSGPAVFALVSGIEKAAEVAWELEKSAPVTIVTSFADRGAEVSRWM